jgi:FkbM family methyltransferase
VERVGRPLLKDAARVLIRATSNRDVEGLGSGSYALIDRSHADKAWYSHRAQLRSLLERLEIDLVVDVGANQGQFVQSIRTFYRGAVLSVEPVASVFEALSAAAAADPEWHVRNIALGRAAAEGSIHVADQSEFSSMLTASAYAEQQFGETARGTRNESVAIRRLDDVLDEIASTVRSRRIFLKLDTQGYDLEVFEGLGHRLTNVLALQSEVSLIPIYDGMPHWTESIARYEAAGFGVVGMYPVTRDGPRVIEYDCLMQRAS